MTARGGPVAASIGPFLAMDVVARANRMAAEAPSGARRILRLEVGQPALGAPRAAIEAAMAALGSGGSLGYTEALGLPALRARIARHYGERYGLDLDPQRIAITTGSSGGFPLAFLASFARDDEVALATPCYPPYANTLRALGLRPRLVEGRLEDRYQPTEAVLDASGPPPAGLLFASPSNPAGTMLAPDALAALLDWARARGVRVVSDEIYHGITHGVPEATAAANPAAIVVGSLSKYWRMTGWRIGWLVLPEALVRPVERLAQNLFISAPHLSQLAAIAAFDAGDELDRSVDGYRRARTHLVERMAQAGLIDIAPADGAFYLYATLPDGFGDSRTWCRRLLEEAGIAATPGCDFDPVRGHRTVRFSYCGPEPDMHEAAERLVEWTARTGISA